MKSFRSSPLSSSRAAVLWSLEDPGSNPHDDDDDQEQEQKQAAVSSSSKSSATATAEAESCRGDLAWPSLEEEFRNSMTNRSHDRSSVVVPKQLYRPKGSWKHAHALLERDDLTEQDVLDFCCRRTDGGGKAKPQQQQQQIHEGNKTSLVRDEIPTHNTLSPNHQQHPQQEEEEDELKIQKENYKWQWNAYRKRRRELFQFQTKQIRGLGGIRTDVDGRLVPVATAAAAANGAANHAPQQHPPAAPPPPPRANFAAAAAAAAADQQQPGDPEDDRRWLEQQEREATQAIQRAVRRYRQAGVHVNDDELQLIRIPVRRRRRNNENDDDDAAANQATHLTLRRICCAVLAVCSAFVCIMIQTLPLYQNPTEDDYTLHSSSSSSSLSHSTMMDPLMKELLIVKEYKQHVIECGHNLDRSPDPRTLAQKLWQTYFSRTTTVAVPTDCSDGVLHIPALSVVIHDFLKTSNEQEVSLLEPFVETGMDHIWRLECRAPPAPSLSAPPNSCYPGWWSEQRIATTASGSKHAINNKNNTCSSKNDVSKQFSCFRGVHDNVITEKDINSVIQMGAELIERGGDHFDIHYDTATLHRKIPAVVSKLEKLLVTKYPVATTTTTSLQPVAFRVLAVGPMDGSNVFLYGIHASAPNSWSRLLNRTNYIHYMEKTARRNELAQYSLPWPVRIDPIRDVCHLMADLQANDTFAILTTVFLSAGAGNDYRGGASLYVDDDDYNDYNHNTLLSYSFWNSGTARRKIRRGLSVDGSPGRVVVSTGGLENLRCRLPTRAGLRAALQIWWDCPQQQRGR